MFDSVSLQTENRFLNRFYKKILNQNLSDQWFQTKSLTSDLKNYTINNSGQFMLDCIFLKDFSGTFEIYDMIDDYWINIMITIENGILTNTKIEYLKHYHGFHFLLKRNEENIPHSSIVYLRRIIEKNETN